LHLVYIDDSGDNDWSCFSALIIAAKDWYEASAGLSKMRADMKSACGIYTSIELHAKDFIGGQGKVAERKVYRGERVSIARGILRRIAKLPGLQIINVVMEKSERKRCFDWLLNRIETNMKYADSYAMLISDNDKNYNPMLVRKRKDNPIPSKLGGWESGKFNESKPITRIVDQIAYRDSKVCPFVQAADFVAYALLRKESPVPSHGTIGIDKLFFELGPALCLAANPSDPHGIVRWVRKK
jgi:hypothetical protein